MNKSEGPFKGESERVAETAGIGDSERAEILHDMLNISQSEKYKIEDEEERNWVGKLHETLKKVNLFKKYAAQRKPEGSGVVAFPTDQIALLMNEVEDRLYVALHEQDLELTKTTILEAHQVLNGAEKVNERGAHAGGCICGECSRLGQIADAFGIDNNIRYSTVCPQYSSDRAVSLEDLYRHDPASVNSAEKYRKSLDERMNFWANLPRAKGRLHSLYREQKSQEQLEAGQNPESAEYLRLAQEYNDARAKSLRTLYFDGSSGTVNAFPGARSEAQEGELTDEKIVEYLEDADMKFLDFDLSIYTDLPVGEKGKYGSSIVTSKDFFRLPEGTDIEELKKILHAKLATLAKIPKLIGYKIGSQDINTHHSRAKEAALVSSLLAKLEDVEGSAKALNLAKELANGLDSTGEGDYSSQSGEKYLAIALAENITGNDPSNTLDTAEGKYMHHLGGFESYSGIGPSTRMHGLHSVAKIRVLAGQDHLPTLSKLKTIDDKIAGASQVAISGFEIWKKIRSKLEELKEARQEKLDHKPIIEK